MSNMIPFNPAGGALAVPSYLQQSFEQTRNDDLYTSQALPSLLYRGKVWRYIWKGEEVAVMDADGNAVPTVEVIMLKANPHNTKAYYAKNYAEGDNAPPDCFSLDGKTPDASVKTPQSPNCATCEWNVFGSRVGADGQAGGKACGDRRRIAVITPDFQVGPLKLDLSPTSMSDRDNKENEARGWYAMRQYGDFLNKHKVNYWGVVTRLGFDSRAAYPKVLFKAVKFLDEASFRQVLEMQGAEDVRQILGVPSDPDTKPADKPGAQLSGVAQFRKPAATPAAESPPAQDDAPPQVYTAPSPDDAAPPKTTKTRKAAPKVDEGDLQASLASLLGEKSD